MTISSQPFRMAYAKDGANSNWLNPITEDESTMLYYVGGTFRIVARAVYGLACLTIFPALGVVYNGYHAALLASNDPNKEFSSHLKATIIDLVVLIGSATMMFYALKAATAVPQIFDQFWQFNKTGVDASNALDYMYAKEKLGINVLVSLLPLLPLGMYTFSPDSFKKLEI